MQLLVAIVILVAVACSGARAETHIVTRPGILCRSSAALAALTLPGGDSRTHRQPQKGWELPMAEKGGCKDLRIGQRLDVVKAFRNTAIVTLDDGPEEVPPAFYVAPVIDLAPETEPHPEPVVPSGREHRSGPDSPVPEKALTSLLGQDEDVFIKAHPDGECSHPQPGVDRCVYHAVDPESCPVASRCSSAIYEFHDGRMVSFQTSLSRGEDWKVAYRQAQGRYPVLRRARTTAGESTFFKTGYGALGFGRTFVQTTGSAPLWEMSFSLTGPAAGAE